MNEAGAIDDGTVPVQIGTLIGENIFHVNSFRISIDRPGYGRRRSNGTLTGALGPIAATIPS